MKSIYASKLYIASSRKDRIHAALLAPSNLALVQQLAEDLDEQYQVPENLGQVETEEPESEEKNESLDDLIVDEDINPETDLVKVDDLDIGKSSSNHSIPAHPSSSGPAKPDKNEAPEGDKPKADTSELIPDSPATEKEPAEASTKITSSTEVKVDPVPAASFDLNALKTTLNNREDCSGVIRIAEKDNEVWIYYKDEINLNNIMTNVIELLINLTEYKSFTFNRLARSDNAIVFEIDLESYQYPEKSLEEVLEENK